MRTLVLGAGGHTGRFVVDDLMRRGLQVTAAGRDRGIAELAVGGWRVPYEPLTLPDRPRLDHLLADADVVVNAAGPFADTALEVVRAATSAGVHYLDVNAEQAVAREIFEAIRGEEARSVVVPSAAFYGGLGDLVATAAAGDWESVETVELVLGLDSWHPTEGTRKTGKRNSGRRLTFRDGRLQAAPARGPLVGSWDYGGALGNQEVEEIYTVDQVTLSTHLATDSVRVRMNTRPMEDLDDPATPPPVLTADGRSEQFFQVSATVSRAGEQRSLTVFGHDIYAISAPIVGLAIEALESASVPPGARALGALVGAETFLRQLEPFGVRIQASKAPLEALPQR